MARKIQVVLKSDVENLGTQGDVAEVRPGYARNYLIPRGLAVMASRGNLRRVEHEKKLALARLAKIRAEVEKNAEAYKSLVVHIAKQVGEEGKLYGSVTTAEIAEAIKRKGHDVDKRKIVMPEEMIKEIGTYEIHIKLGAGVTVPIKLEVKTAS